MARYPRALWKPVARYQPGGSSARQMSKVNRYMLHTAVSNSDSLFAMMNQPGTATSHFYVRKDGVVEQYIDTAICSTACLDGNNDSITVETWDGYPHGWANGSDVPRWTDAQLQTLADMAAWVHETHGVPLEPCPNSRPGSVGVAYHRQGIDDWRVDGGEYWSASQGKVCPGDRRVAQIPQIISMAQGGDTDMALTDEDIEKIARAVAKRTNAVIGDYGPDGEPRDPDKKDPEAGNVRLTQIENIVRRLEETKS